MRIIHIFEFCWFHIIPHICKKLDSDYPYIASILKTLLRILKTWVRTAQLSLYLHLLRQLMSVTFCLYQLVFVKNFLITLTMLILSRCGKYCRPYKKGKLIVILQFIYIFNLKYGLLCCICLECWEVILTHEELIELFARVTTKFHESQIEPYFLFLLYVSSLWINIYIADLLI